MTPRFWELIGWGCLWALLFFGWPRFFTINIHKHYHGKDEGGD